MKKPKRIRRTRRVCINCRVTWVDGEPAPSMKSCEHEYRVDRVGQG